MRGCCRFSLLICLALVVSFSPPVFAQSAPDHDESDDPLAETEIVITAVDDDAGIEPDDDEEGDSGDTVTTTARAPIPGFATIRSLDVIDEEAILERQAGNISDAVSEESGVYRQATNRGADSLYMRGLIGPENLMLVDGVRFNQSTFRTGPNQYLATLDPWAFDRIESVRGPGSVLYGSGAMGGVLQMFPRTIDEEEGFHGRAIGQYKSADHTLGGALDADYRQDFFAGTAGISHRNHQTLRPGSRGGDDLFLAAEQDGRMLASAYRQSFWRAGGEIDIDDDIDLDIRYMGGLIEDARRTDQIGRGQMRSADNRDDLAWARLTHQALPVADELSVHGAYHRTDELTRRFQCAVNDGDGDQPALVTDLEACAALQDDVLTEQRNLHDVVHTVGTGLAAYSQIAPPLRISYGAEAYRDHVRSSREDATAPAMDFVTADRGNFADGSTYATLGAYTHGEWSVWHSGLHEAMLTGGGRVEHFRAVAPEVTEELGDVEFANTGLVAALGVSYLYDTTLNLYLHWNQGFRAPNLQEATVLGDTGNFYEVPNPDLNAERNDTFELGTKVDLSSIGQVSTSVFASLMRDRITRSPTTFDGQSEIDGKPVQERINADLAYFYGAELKLRSANHYGLEWFGNLAWIDGAVQSDESDPNFQPGPFHAFFERDADWTNPRRLPPLQFLSGITYRPDRSWSATFYVEGTGSQDKLSRGDHNDPRICEAEVGVLYAPELCPGTPAWATLNVRGTYRFDERLFLNLSATNLMDRRYQYHGSGMFGPGIQAMTTVTLRH